MFKLASACMEMIMMVLQGYCLQFFYGSFLETRTKSKRLGGVFTAVIYGAWRMWSGAIGKQDEVAGMLLRLSLTICVLAALAVCFYRAAGRITFFLVIAFATVNDISFFLSYMLLQLGVNIFDLWYWCFQKGYIIDADAYLTTIEVTALGLQAVDYAVFVLILYFVLKGIVGNFREKEYAIHRTELLFILAPNLIGLLICILLRTTIEMAENKTPEFLYNRYPLLMFIIPAILILSLLSILCGVKLFQDMIDLSRERSSRVILEKQIAGMQEHMKEMERVYSGIRSMKHDMRNTLSVVMQLAAQDTGEKGSVRQQCVEEKTGKQQIPDDGQCLHNKELQDYLAELNHSMEQLEFRFKTGNSVADTLLNMKYYEIIHVIPDLRMEAEGLVFPDTLAVQSYDLGIILGNALDNAGEACRKLKEKDPEADAFIRLDSFKKGKFLFIKIENSFDGIISRKRTSEFPVTDKKDKDSHGIGLINIQNTVEKYQGTMDWKVTEGVFTLSVMIKPDNILSGKSIY